MYIYIYIYIQESNTLYIHLRRSIQMKTEARMSFGKNNCNKN